MPALPTHVLRLCDLSSRGETSVVLEPGAAERAVIAAELGLKELRKVRFAARMTPLGARDWELTAELGATVVQPCVVTLAPVKTRIDEPLTRRYLADFATPEGGTEVEMPDDDSAEPLPDTLDLYAVAIEALALAVPPWPRAEGALVEQTTFAAPGTQPMSDDDAKPFAGLAAMRGKLDPESPDPGDPEGSEK